MFAIFSNINCRSDVLSQFMPLVGVDWSQNGVAHLFSAIKICCGINNICNKKVFLKKERKIKQPRWKWPTRWPFVILRRNRHPN
jgi:hypothetical protein